MGRHITCYSGQLFHQDDWSKLPVDMKQYGAGVPPVRPIVVDARVDFEGGLGRFLNQSTRGGANCVLEWVEVAQRPSDIFPCGYVSVKSTKNIRRDEEVFLNYGAGHVWNTAKHDRKLPAELPLHAAEKTPDDNSYSL